MTVSQSILNNIETSAPAVNIAASKEEDFIQISGITVDLLEESVRITLGNGFYKFISYPDFINSLSTSISSDSVTGSLQDYILAPNTFFLSVSQDRVEMSMYYPECHRNLIYGNHTRPSVIPNIVISHGLKRQSGDEWRVVDTKYWTTNKQLSEINRKCYLRDKPAYFSIMPFTNVYTDGNLCYGSNVRIINVKLPDFRPLHWYYEMLFTSPFNNDLGISALKNSSPYRGNYPGWYDHLAKLATEKTPFPYDQLAAFS